MLYASRNTVSSGEMFLRLLSLTQLMYAKKYIYLIIRLKIKINFKTVPNLFYVQSQSVPHSRHFPPRL
jgi:hypothetical protein